MYALISDLSRAGGGMLRMRVPLSLPLQDIIHDYCQIMGINEKQCSPVLLNHEMCVDFAHKRRSVPSPPGVGDGDVDGGGGEGAVPGDAVGGAGGAGGAGEGSRGGVAVISRNARKEVLKGTAEELDLLKSCLYAGVPELRAAQARLNRDKPAGKLNNSNSKKGKKDEHKEILEQTENEWDTPGVKYFRGTQTLKETGLRYKNDVLDIIYSPTREEVSAEHSLPFDSSRDSVF